MVSITTVPHGIDIDHARPVSSRDLARGEEDGQDAPEVAQFARKEALKYRGRGEQLCWTVEDILCDRSGQLECADAAKRHARFRMWVVERDEKARHWQAPLSSRFMRLLND